MDRLKIGMVGLGRWGRNLLRAVCRVEDAEVTAFCDADLHALAASSRGIPEPDGHVFTSFTEMLDEADVDAVIIATPPHSHAVIACDALDRGKHVFVEKPMATSTDEIAAIKEYLAPGLAFMIGHTFLYNDLVRWMKEYIDGGGIGKIMYATSSWLNWGTVRRNVDAFWNFAPSVHPHSPFRFSSAGRAPYWGCIHAVWH